MSEAHQKLQALWLSRWPTQDECLVAFVVPTPEAPCEPEALRTWLAQSLPDYMVPAQIFLAADLPRHASGKLNRRALRPPFAQPAATRVQIAPRSAAEERIAGFFEQVLGVRPHSVDDDFFTHLGGHSLVATQLASLIREAWPIAFPLRVVFESPTVAGLADYVEQARMLETAPDSIPRLARNDGTAA
jgi:acyl carrier protein